MIPIFVLEHQKTIIRRYLMLASPSEIISFGTNVHLASICSFAISQHDQNNKLMTYEFNEL